MAEYRFALPAEEADILDFINFVFSKAYRPHDFKRFLPKVYTHPGFSALHAVAVENGHVRGTAGLLPLTLRTGSETLRVGYIGSVSAHPYDRGAGHMRGCMELLLRRAREEGLDVLALGGQRQRYGYYGFAPGGCQMQFTVTRDNARHALAQTPGGLTLREIVPEDETLLSKIHALHKRQIAGCIRARETLFDTLCSWQAQPYALLDAETQEFRGALCAKEDYLHELLLENEADLPRAFKAFLQTHEKAAISVADWERERIAFLRGVAEGYQWSDAFKMQVLRWRETLEKLLQFKHSYRPLVPGQRVIEIEGEGRFQITVTDAGAAVSPTRAPAQRTLPPQAAVQLFFSPGALALEDDPLLRAWLPLPLSLGSLDKF